jgi:hypothetical protein
MDEEFFLNHYADEKLREWWRMAPCLQDQMLELLTALHATPLAQLDQFTVGLHTNQPDGWRGPRLVFAVRNNTAPNGRATRNTICLSLALNPAEITASVNYRLDLHDNGQPRATDATGLLPLLEQHQLRVQATVNMVVLHRQDGGQRAARMPCEYQ